MQPAFPSYGAGERLNLSRMSRGRVLCLHGAQQTSETFRSKLGNLVTKLRRVVELDFIDGPHECALREGDELPTRTWFLRDAERRVETTSLEMSLRLLETFWRERIYVGIIGFSQGGSLAAILASRPDRFPGLRFILIGGAPDLPDLQIPPSVRSLHLIGKADEAVSVASSLQLSRRFHEPVVVEHEQGHIIPSRAEFLRMYVDFVERNIPKESSPSDTSHQDTFLCSSDEVAAAQAEELEVLSSIYPAELEVLSPAPQAAGDPCAEFLLHLPSDSVCDGDVDVKWRERVVKELSLRFQCTPEYPNEMLPVVTLIRGGLSMGELPTAMERELTLTLKAQMNENAGSPLGFICMQVLIDWLSRHRQSSPSKEAEAISSEITTNTSTEDTDADSSEMIQRATEEAYAVNSNLKGSGGDALDAHSEPPPPSARGVWSYTVGLVGKPSAGKSTFYNAVTKAALDREGRLMAAVAPHPFTTIEPNVAPGWYASMEGVDAEGGRAAQYGRDAIGRRLLPVIVKDVAGLVPGAYKGRGKGNRFLNDLCDADVLIHVVDVTGQSDRDGNIIADADPDSKRSSPIEDARWIREELHRWVHGNIKAKWCYSINLLQSC